MDSCPLLLILLVCILNPFCIESWKLSKEEDLELDRQLKLLSKPSVRTIKNRHGTIYDCVDFYKQPAFDHPLLKNFTFEKSKLLQLQRRVNDSSKFTQGISLPFEGCPLGTVPIRRITKEDLVREKLALKIRSLAIDGTHFALDRTRATPKRYGGIMASFSLWNPSCEGNQYSAARLRIANGPDNLEAGWRVDPALYGDGLTHFYIRTNVAKAQCFDTRCPRFVVLNPKVPLEYVYYRVSERGKRITETSVNILRDFKTGDWMLQVGPKNLHIRMWPAGIFTSHVGLGELASSLDWGGEVFSPPGQLPKPPMGAGDYPVGDTYFDAYFRLMQELNESGQPVDANDVETFVDNKHYKVKDEGFHPGSFGHLMIYGGPGGSTD